MLISIVFLFTMTIMGAASATGVNITGEQYQSGQAVTQAAMNNTNLALNNSASNLVITTAGSATLNNKSTEDGLQAVVDTTGSLKTGQAITHGSGNMLILNDPNGALTYTFVSLASNGALMAQTYTITGTSSSYAITHGSSVYIGSNMTLDQWNLALKQLGSNAYNIICIANLWAAGAPADLLAETYTTGGINQGTIANYAMTRTFALTYPSLSDGEPNYVITNAGGLDDDALMYGVFGFNEILFSTSSGKPGETAFIHYNAVKDSVTNVTTRSGVLALMKENDLTSQFTATTGVKVVKGTLSEIQYNLWLLNLLKTNAAALFTVEALKSVNEKDISYLWYDNSVGYGHGIDKSYIAGLNSTTTIWNTNVVPVTDYNAMFAQGQQAFNAAYSSGLFSLEDLANGNVAVVLAPYYVNLLNNYSLVGFIDGIVSAAKSILTAAGYTNAAGFTIDNILQIRNPWTWGSNTGSALTSVFVKVDPNSQKAHDVDSLVMSGVQVRSTYKNGVFSTTAGSIINASPSNIASGSVLGGNFAIPAVAGIAYAWAANAPYNYIRTIGRVGCICSTKEYDLSSYLQRLFPLGSNEHYILLALTGAGETNRQISGRTAGWGVSPSQGTYYSMQSSNSAYPIILIIWNDVTGTGKAILIQYDDTAITTAMKAEEYTAYAQENGLFWHLDQVWNNGADARVLDSAIIVAKGIDNINPAFLKDLTAAGGDPIQKMLTYVAPVSPTNPEGTSDTSGTSGTSGTTPIIGSIGNGLSSTITALTSAVNGLVNSNIQSAADEIASIQTSNTPTTATTPTNNNSGLPLGSIVVIIFLAVAAILAYLRRNTIIDTVRRTERFGK